MGWNNDDRLLIRSIREGWDTPADKKAGVLSRVIEIATSRESSARESTAAMKALLAAAKLQLETIRLEMQVEDHEALKRRLEALESSASGEHPGDATGPARADPPESDDDDGGPAGPGAA